MQRRNNPHLRLAAATATVALVLAACGDDGAEPAAQPGDSIPTPDTTIPTDATNAPVDGAMEHPTGSDEVVVEIAYEGGFMPMEAVFTQLPVLLVAGDGSQYVQGPQIEIYPGPLLPNVQVSEIGEDGIQSLLDLAAEHGLLTEREYESPDNIADASDTVVTIRANGETYVHRAYALGIGGGLAGPDETGDRAELQAFVDAATADTIGGDPTGGEQSFDPETYLVRATPVDELSIYEVEPTVTDWPADVSLVLADAAECAEVPAADVADLFTDANQLTFFVEGDVTYQLSVKPELPGDSC
jgi:hypothetical protein